MSSLWIRCPSCEKAQELRPLIGRHEIPCTSCGRLNIAVTFADSLELRARLLPNAFPLGVTGGPLAERNPPPDGVSQDGVLAPLDLALLECLQILGANKGNIQLFDEKAGGLAIRSQMGFGADFLALFRVVKLGEDCTCGQAFQARKRIICRNVFVDDRFQSLRRIFLQEGLSAVVSTPLVDRKKKVVGMFSAHFSRPHQPSAFSLGLLDRSLGRVERIIQYLA